MKISANSIRAGNILFHDNALHIVTKTPEHTKPGKGGAYVQVEMKKLKDNTKINHRFSSSDYVEKAYLEGRKYQYLYRESDDFFFMDCETFEQIILGQNVIGEARVFLLENMIITVEMFDSSPVNVQLPPTVVLQIDQTDPVIRDAASKPSYKPALLSNGIIVKVPHYLVSGDKIIVKTEDASYVERAK